MTLFKHKTNIFISFMLSNEKQFNLAFIKKFFEISIIPFRLLGTFLLEYDLFPLD